MKYRYIYFSIKFIYNWIKDKKLNIIKSSFSLRILPEYFFNKKIRKKKLLFYL